MRWLRILFNVLIGRETPQNHPVGGRKDAESADEAGLRRHRAPVDQLTRPVRLYGTTDRGKKVHIRQFHTRDGLFLCGAKPGLQAFSSIPPVDETELCSNCLSLVGEEAK